MWGNQNWERFGLNELKYSLVDLKTETVDRSSVKIISTIKAEGKVGFANYHTATYLIKGDGSVTVDNKIQFVGLRINLARIGVRFLFNKNLDEVAYFGRGPWENYADRKSSADIGLYTLHVNDQYEYEKPMDQGNHEDVRWAMLTSKNASSVMIQADKNLMQFSALKHTDEEMFPVEYKIDLPESKATVFTLSTKTLGVGSASCGPKPLEKYLIWSDNIDFSYTLKLIQSK
jgi:beta-galactosidase